VTIPLILASKSRPRRDILFSAGICPTIRVSQVDEVAAVADLAAREGISIEEIPAERRVLFLSGVKARAVADVYHNVRESSLQAHGQRVTVHPLEANGGTLPSEPAAPIDPQHLPKAASIEPLTEALDEDKGLEGLKKGPFILGCDSMFDLDGVAYGKPHDVATARERLKRMRGKRGVLWTGHTLIDLATGQQERAVSMAQVTFSDFSDEEIERYLDTGEPLEVAGSFTLEGFGGAFIESVSGDPHGVIGLSLPLLRKLFQRFDVSWPDLWNTTRAQQRSVNPDNPSAPLDNVHQPGDGWVDCACGHRHWGLNGASGVLLARRNPQTGTVTDIVLQHRSAWSAEGGTWGNPGGASADGENALEGALRESFEEANINPEDIDVVGSYKEDHGPWSYTTVFAFEKPGHAVNPRANDDESTEVQWVPFEKVASYNLMGSFKKDWEMAAAWLQEVSASMAAPKAE
jgi:septum formation protein